MSQRIKHTEWDIVPQVGSYIELDNGHLAYLDHDDTEWELCDFRVRAGGGLYHLATKVKVTGHTLQYRYGTEYVRVKLTYVADPSDIDVITGEPNSVDIDLGGWMRVGKDEKVWNQAKFDRIYAEAIQRQQIREEADRRDAEQRRAARQQRRAERECQAALIAQAARRAASRAASLEL